MSGLAWRVSVSKIPLIADVTFSCRRYGYSKQKACKQFARNNDKMPKLIVDQVYASNKSRGELKVAIWHQCMDKIEHE